MPNKKQISGLLNRYFHTHLNSKESKILEDALKGDPELRSEKSELEKLQRLLSEQEFRFKPFFAGRVMTQLELAKQPAGLLGDLNYAFTRISIPTMLALFVWVLIFWGSDGSLSVDGLLGVSEFTYDELMNDFFVSN